MPIDELLTEAAKLDGWCLDRLDGIRHTARGVLLECPITAVANLVPGRSRFFLQTDYEKAAVLLSISEEDMASIVDAADNNPHADPQLRAKMIQLLCKEHPTQC